MKHEFEYLKDQYCQLLLEAMRLYRARKNQGFGVEDYFNMEIETVEKMFELDWDEFLYRYGKDYGFDNILTMPVRAVGEI